MLQKQSSRSWRVVAKYAATQPEQGLRGLITCADPHVQFLNRLLEDASEAAAAKKFSAMADGADLQETQYPVVLRPISAA